LSILSSLIWTKKTKSSNRPINALQVTVWGIC
jgi:hypothetical protein